MNEEEIVEALRDIAEGLIQVGQAFDRLAEIAEAATEQTQE